MLYSSRKDSLVAPAIALLNSNVADFDTVKVRTSSTP